MEKILGNYLNQPNRDFPLDAETLDYLQQLAGMSAILGNIAGDRVILRGCELSGGGIRRGSGWVFVRTREFPEGEILAWEGGPVGGGMYLKQADIRVTANNRDYPKAYRRRSLAPGYGDETFSWEDFRELRTLEDLRAENEKLRGEMEKLGPAPLGVIEMWAGANVPEGYVLCDGRQLRQTDYPELYKALGVTFSTAVSANGTSYTTDAGFFRVPDLRGRFVVGQHDSDADYTQKGAGGGAKSVALKEEELPSHGHDFKDYYHADARNMMRGNYDAVETNSMAGSKGTDYDNDCLQYYEHTTEKTGQGCSHENRPPYYVLAYIMRVR